MSPPPEGQSAVEVVRNVSNSQIAQAIGWVVATLSSIVVALLGYIGVRESRKVSALFAWKDDTVDPFMRDVPKIYATKAECVECRETIHRYITVPNQEAHREMKEHLCSIDEKIDKLLERE